jgi:hypothetical protein
MKRTVDPTRDYLRMLHRMIRAAGPKVGQGDPEHLAQLIELHSHLATAIQNAVDQQRANGITWQSIGEATGTTRQAAIMKWTH